MALAIPSLIREVLPLPGGPHNPITLPLLLGLVIFSHIIAHLLKKYKDQTLSILTGFISGSLLIVWPWKKIKSSDLSFEDLKKINKALNDFQDIPESQFGFYESEDYIKAEKEYLKAQKIFQKDIKKGKINLFDGLLNIDLMAENPNLKIKGFSIKDTLYKTFNFIGKNTKGLRGNLKNLAKTKVGGVSPMGVAKGLGKLAPVVDFGITLPLAFNELGLVDFSDGILKPKVGRDNIVTSVYDMFTAFYNAGVEGLGFDDAYKRLKISKPKDGEISGSLIPFTNIGAYKYNPS